MAVMTAEERAAARRELRNALPEFAEWADAMRAVFAGSRVTHAFDIRNGRGLETGRPGEGASPLDAPPPKAPKGVVPTLGAAAARTEAALREFERRRAKARGRR